MKIYDIAVIGAGPAGCMAAIRGAQLGKNVILLERNNKIGRKLLLTGHGRCNLTNTANLEVFLEMFGRNGSFYRNVFGEFSNQDLMDFFKNHGLELKEEESGRIFPITEKSKSVVDVLKKVLDEYGVKILYNYRLEHLHKQSKIFKLYSTEDRLITAHNVIIATGGASYGITGSTGDGFTIAELLGHHITELKPGGVPLTVREEWVHELKGVTLDNVGLNIRYGGKIKPLPRGNLLFTHFGISGPVILDMSQIIVDIMDKHGDLKLCIDFKPEIKEEALGILLMEDFQNYSKKSLRNYLKNHFPQSMIDPVLKSISLDPQKKLNQITKKERLQLQKTLKALPLTITGHLPLDKALVTCGGVSKKQIDPQTMESKLVKRLYFAGEIIAGCGRRGGYNLQQAFSTGYVAGNSASEN
jgi:predicted Rossmann fold flavoprotein